MTSQHRSGGDAAPVTRGNSLAQLVPDSFPYREALEAAVGLGAQAREIIRARPITRREFKANRADAVTDVDTRVESLVKQALSERFPADGFVGEELPDTHVRDRTWYCDPVDGTANFTVGVPFYGFTLSLEQDGQPVLGVVEDPVRDRTFLAASGHGAWLLAGGSGAPAGADGTAEDSAPDAAVGTADGTPLDLTAISRHQELAGAMVLTELLGTAPWPGMGAFLDEIGRREATSRILGSSALTVCMVAEGTADAAFLADYSPVDLGASVLAAREAGCTVRMLDPAETEGILPRACVIGEPAVVEAVAGLAAEAITGA